MIKQAQFSRAAGVRRHVGIGRSAVALLATVVVGAGLTAVPASATSYPTDPSGVRVSSASASSFTVTARASQYATGYRLFASTNKTQVYVTNISQAHRSGVMARPSVTIGSLPNSTATWYYRFGAVNSRGIRYSEILSTNLRPAMPTNLVMHTGATGTSLTWSGGSSLGYRIAQSTDAAMVGNRRNYTVTSSARQFTPYGLRSGTRYYFRVSAVNGSSGSTYSTRASGVAAAHEQAVRVQTYNVLQSSTAGFVEGDGPLAPWSQRRTGVARVIRAASADVVAIEEGGGWAGSIQGYGGSRQVDDLAQMLGASSGGPAYGLAATEIPPSQHAYTRTGNYILYKTSTYAPSGPAGHWTVGGHSAAFQVLKSRSTGARFLFVAAHLSPLGGTPGDTERAAETKSLISQAQAVAAQQHVPVIYAGDFNSHSAHLDDAPTAAFNAAHASDALRVAQTKVNAGYNSANQNVHQPLVSGLSIDHVYAPAGVAVRTWQLSVELSNGRYVGILPSDHNALTVDLIFPRTS